MRSLLAILQLLMMMLPTFAPVAALRGDSKANVPACCRRNGAHHCMMTEAQRLAILAGVQAKAMPEHCPFSPKAVASAQHSPSSLAPSAMIFAQVVSHPACTAQTLAKRRISQDRSQQKRGPPFIA